MAIGLVTGLIPGPVQILLAVIGAIIFRANVPAAAFTTLYTNPITFVPLYLLAYKVGALVTGANANAVIVPPDISWSFAGLFEIIPQLLRWIASLGDTLIIGLVLQASVFAVIGYIATMLAWRCAVSYAWKARHKRKKA